MKLNKKHVVVISVLVLFLSLSTVNAVNVTVNQTSNNSYTGSSSHVHSDHKVSTVATASRNVKEIKITNNNYLDNFNVYTGRILPSADIIAGDTLRIGNMTDKAFTIDRRLTLTTICDGDQITNGVIHLIAGSDGSIVTGLKIINDKTVYTVNGIYGVTLNGIWLTNSSNNTISYNSVKVADAYKVFAMPMGWSSYNTIIYNSLISTWSTCMPMGQCHYNNISNNYIQATNANLIYYNPYGHADYGGSPLCVGNYISNNYLYSIYMSDLVIAMQMVYEPHDNTTIINNTFDHVWDGINLWGENSLIKGNHFINALYSHAIYAGGNNVTVSDNVINVKSALMGISVQGTSKNPNNTIKNNSITFTDGCTYAIYTDPNFRVFNNIINLPKYGKGIVGCGSIFNNTIKANKDVGIEINGGNSVVTGNKVTTHSYGIHIVSLTTRIYGNFIGNNTITSSLYGIYLEGLIYNTTISGNMIYTSASKGIYKNTTDDFGDESSDNTINGIINDATAIIVDDSNFYTYFDKNGYLKFKSFKSNPVIILTHLTDKNLKFTQKVILTSNGMANLLYNVIITLYPDSSGSVIKELNFYNTNLNGIILAAGTDNVNITRNNITIISDNNFKGSLSGISSNGVCENVNITNNNIFMKTKNGYIYGITAGAYDPDTARYATDFSKYFTISNNNIILLGNKLSEGIYTDSLIYSNITSNTINIKSGSYGYGIATANIMGSLHDLNLTNNSIVVNVNGMAYLIELHMSNNVLLMNNTLDGTGSGVYGICGFKTNNVTIKSNKIHTLGGNLSLTDPKNYDVLGNGNAAIFLTAGADTTNILLNMIYTNAAKQMIFKNSLNTVLARNSYVIAEGNLLNYFNSTTNGELLKDGIIQANDTLMFADLNKYVSLIFEIPLNLTSYTAVDSINASFILKSGASNTIISNLIFNLTDKTAITLVDAVGVQIKNNAIHILNIANSSVKGILIALNSVSNQIVNNLIDMNGKNSLYAINVSNNYQNRYGRSPKSNSISNNTINIKSDSTAIGIYIAMADNTQIYNNNFSLVSNKIYGIITDYSPSYLGFGTLPTNNTHIVSNRMNGNGSLIYFIESLGAYNNEVKGNAISSISNISYGYVGFKSTGDMITNNTLLLNGKDKVSSDKIGTGQTGVYYSLGSTGNRVLNNYIISTYSPGEDYAVFIATNISGINWVNGNYLISDNGKKLANNAVYAPYEVVENNTPSYVYVSSTGSDSYGTGSKTNPYNTIAKAIEQAKNRAVIYLLKGTYHESGLIIKKTLTISSLDGKVLIDGNKNQIFYISNTGDLTLNGLNITNAYANKGSVLINYGNLNINNSEISNNKAVNDGGSILNYGDLSIIKSVLNSNSAGNGGSISNYGNAYFDGCTMNYNSALNGGAIFNNATADLDILNSVF
ncbi:MAG: right-handed parallel beta-helix repeat-containing protein [Methanobacterium sp. ERen5]|nr:MAG: right-handed parallel beta-helix repeat-containing protein [Methanobacterium sp. ERen5]